MRREPVTLDEGRSVVRAWRVESVRGETHVAIWTPLPGKLLLAAASAAVLFPAPMLWLEASGLRISHWVVATVYSLAALFAVAGVVHCAGRERVRVRRREIVVEHFDLVTWTLTQLESVKGVGIWIRDGWWTGLSRSLLVGTSVRAVTFGFWLDASASERVAELLREVVTAQPAERAELDGIVRRVERLRDVHTMDGADDLVVGPHRSALVFRGTLREPALLSPWVAMVLIAVLLPRLIPHTSAGIGMSLGGLIVVVAVTMCRGGVVDQLTAVRARRVARAFPDEPWRAVSRWRSLVMGRSFLRRAARDIGVALLFAALSAVALSGWVGRPSVARTVTGSCLGLAALLSIYRSQNLFFQGLTEVRLREMPYPTLGDVAIDFAVARSGAEFHGITFTLSRLVQVRRAGRPPAVGYSHIGHYDLPEDEPPPGPGEQVTARFTLPADARGTDFDAKRPVYWELLVEGETSCGRYAESFVIPIYDSVESSGSNSVSVLQRSGSPPEPES